MLEEVGEYVYRIDRALAQVTSSPAVRVAAGIRLGRCSDIPPNDPDFGRDEEAVAREWCMRSGIQWLGRADIGHEIGRAHVLTPVTNAHLVCRLLLEKKKNKTYNTK